MKSKELRKKFLDYFKAKSHEIVSSAPMVVKDDPTLMFTNAGMNQFKDIFQGNKAAANLRVANTQKCLRVSGKHNDLEEVGHDTYHHTMFEMMGNWSFGDYFKSEAIDFAWDFLTGELGIDKKSLYVTIFEGNPNDGVERDTEAYDCWLKHVDADRIIDGNSKDNFWEMGETGPCGPCSEIHIDIRDEEDKLKVPGKELVNQDHPLVIEIWNLVFIQYLRKANRDLEKLPAQHVDTGMGFERLCMVMQGVKSNYDTDVFQSVIQKISYLSEKKYGEVEKDDIAMRVIADHLRAVAFSIADGQLPSNNKAGYVIRRILRRAVRYGYSFLDLKKPFICKLIPTLLEVMGEAFPELESQKELITNVIKKEEETFLNTLEVGLKLLDNIIKRVKCEKKAEISGKEAFELYDTYGFPLDLTELILCENNLGVNHKEFEEEMKKQKERSRKDAKQTVDDWNIILQDDVEEFVGYDYTSTDVRITRYRSIEAKGSKFFQIVFNITPFYGESGGQIGDSGYIEDQNGEKTSIIDTKKENGLIIHLAKKLPKDPSAKFKAVVDVKKRTAIANNHTATHLVHHALRKVLGDHVEQKGSLVNADHFRFDFSHFQKVSNEEIREVEKIVNSLIRENISVEEKRAIPIAEAQSMGAMALFGEKYGDLVRAIKIGDSVELCGGTHAKASGQIGMIKIVSESAIAAGIRRIEVISAAKAEKFVYDIIDTFDNIRGMFKNSQNTLQNIEKIISENAELNKQLEEFNKEKVKIIKNTLKNSASVERNINIIAEEIAVESANDLKDISFQLKSEMNDLFLVLGAVCNGKPMISIMISDELVKNYGLNAGNMIREAAKEIKGGGGGQPFFATAGGKNPDGITDALNKAKQLLVEIIHD